MLHVAQADSTGVDPAVTRCERPHVCRMNISGVSSNSWRISPLSAEYSVRDETVGISPLTGASASGYAQSTGSGNSGSAAASVLQYAERQSGTALHASFLAGLTSGLSQMGENRMRQLQQSRPDSYNALSAWHVFQWHAMSLEERLEQTFQGMLVLGSPQHGLLDYHVLTRFNLCMRMLQYLLNSRQNNLQLFSNLEDFLDVLIVGRAWSFAARYNLDPRQWYADSRRSQLNSHNNIWLDHEIPLGELCPGSRSNKHRQVRLYHLLDWKKRSQTKTKMNKSSMRDIFCRTHNIDQSGFGRLVYSNGCLSRTLKKYLQGTLMTAVDGAGRAGGQNTTGMVPTWSRSLPGRHEAARSKPGDWAGLAASVDTLSGLLLEWPPRKRHYCRTSFFHLYEWHTLKLVDALELMLLHVQACMARIDSRSAVQECRKIQHLMVTVEGLREWSVPGRSDLMDYMPIPDNLIKMMQIGFSLNARIDPQHWCQIADSANHDDWCKSMVLTKRSNHGFQRVTYLHLLQYWRQSRRKAERLGSDEFRKFCADAGIAYGSFYRFVNWAGCLTRKGSNSMKRKLAFPSMPLALSAGRER